MPGPGGMGGFGGPGMGGFGGHGGFGGPGMGGFGGPGMGGFGHMGPPPGGMRGPMPMGGGGSLLGALIGMAIGSSMMNAGSSTTTTTTTNPRNCKPEDVYQTTQTESVKKYPEKCPNCGAPNHGLSYCEYCDTKFC